MLAFLPALLASSWCSVDTPSITIIQPNDKLSFIGAEVITLRLGDTSRDGDALLRAVRRQLLAFDREQKGLLDRQAFGELTVLETHSFDRIRFFLFRTERAVGAWG